MVILSLLLGWLRKFRCLLKCFIVLWVMVRFRLVLLVMVLGVWKKCLFSRGIMFLGMLGLLFFMYSLMLLLFSVCMLMVMVVLWLV